MAGGIATHLKECHQSLQPVRCLHLSPTKEDVMHPEWSFLKGFAHWQHSSTSLLGAPCRPAPSVRISFLLAHLPTVTMTELMDGVVWMGGGYSRPTITALCSLVTQQLYNTWYLAHRCRGWGGLDLLPNQKQSGSCLWSMVYTRAGSSWLLLHMIGYPYPCYIKLNTYLANVNKHNKYDRGEKRSRHITKYHFAH